MGKFSYALFACALLALFVAPVSAMQPNEQEPMNGNPTPMLGAAGPNDGPGTPPMPGEGPQMTGIGNAFNGTAPGNNTVGAGVSRAQLIRNRIANAVQARNATVNASMIRDKIAERARLAVAVKAQDLRQTENFLLQARQVMGTLNATQKRQLANVVYGFVNSSLQNRVQTAYRFEQRGIDPAKVEAFNASMEALKAQIAAANSTQERVRLVNQANRQWTAFKQDVVKEAARNRLLNATGKAQAALDKLNTIIANLAANGTDTSKLENISARVQNRINAANEGNITLRQMEWRLAFARDGLAHLAAQVRNAVRKQAIEDLADEVEPEELAVEDAAEEAVPTPEASPTEIV